MKDSSNRQMNCFCSMTFGNRVSDWVRQVASDVARKHGLSIVCADEKETVWRDVRQKVCGMIDEAFLVIVEASGFSWYVAFEFFYAHDKKHCIMLLLDENLPGPGFDRSIDTVFPEKLFQTYRLPLPLPNDRSESRLRKKLADAFMDALELSNQWSISITQHLLKASGRTPPAAPIKPIIKDNELSANELFAEWRQPRARANQIVIVGAQGSGKTVLLSRFADHLGSVSNRMPSHVRDLQPVGIFMITSNIPEKFGAESLWPVVCNLVFQSESELANQERVKERVKHPGLLEPYCRAGLVYLLFDGLDELGTRRPGDADTLMNAFQEIACKGVNIILTCRRNYWERIQLKNNYKAIDIQPFSTEQMQGLLADEGIALPETAYQRPEGKLKPWITNPLSLVFIISIHSSKAREWKEVFSSRTQMYETWARHMIEQTADRVSVTPEALWSFLGTIALQLLEARKTSTQWFALGSVMEAALGRSALRRKQVSAMEILKLPEGSEEVSFVHETVYEFFVARTLKGEFYRAVTENLDRGELEKFWLARVGLDYLQSSTYGFLSEFFEPRLDEFLNALKIKLRRVSKAKSREALKMPDKLLRNLVECLGLIYRQGDVRNIAGLLLSLIKNKAIGVTVRFNAARALERIHPQAPHPYFDYVSDWGELDWSKERSAKMPKEKAPSVMLGMKREVAKPGRHFEYTPDPRTLDRSGHLQEEVSKELGGLIEELFLDPSIKEDESPVRINCANAWLRWYSPREKGLLRKLRDMAERRGFEKETQYNLKLLWDSTESR
ncbi:MAG TPA: NACHT domain-containing protein [Blastocatellia bacterium]|nr:NACHT domain-containing protein [Blastocatellia bacterium]